MLEILAFVIAFFFAINIGASGTAAAMGPAYGSGAIKRKMIAMILVAVFAWLGAIFGGEVVRTIGNGIIPSTVMQLETIVIVLSAACLTLYTANIIGIPLSTSEVLVGSLIGAGIAYQAIYIEKIIMIVALWLIGPLLSFFLTYLMAKILKKYKNILPLQNEDNRWNKFFVILLVTSGCMEAFAAGMNNAANAVGPLVGVGLIQVNVAVIVGGFFVALGAILLGGKVLETNGKQITKLSYLQGSLVSFTGGSLVILASIFGIPMPLTQVTTASIVGIGTADNGFILWRKEIVVRILKVWIVSPLFALAVSYFFILVFRFKDYYTLVVMISIVIATIGIISLYRSIQLNRKSIVEEKNNNRAV